MKEKYLFVPPKPKFTNKVIDKKDNSRVILLGKESLDRIMKFD